MCTFLIGKTNNKSAGKFMSAIFSLRVSHMLVTGCLCVNAVRGKKGPRKKGT